MKISELTYKVISYSEIPNFNTDDCVDWATEMLELGYESESLMILAGISKPTNYFEIIDYLKNALTELNMTIKTGEDAILCYSSYYINRISKSVNVKENLGMIYSFCLSKDYEKQIFDFYLLHWAWSDFDYGEKFTNYWDNADKENIEEIVIQVAKKWMTENQSIIKI
ncbi:MAG: hypothetical protein V4666_12305 [Bacteroidota bacterium]